MVRNSKGSNATARVYRAARRCSGHQFQHRSLYAQEAGRIIRIGFVSAAPREEAWYIIFEELHGLGFVEGQNLTVIPGGFGVRNELLSGVAAALGRAAPDAIVAAGPIAARAAQAATKTIPILAASDDMVDNGGRRQCGVLVAIPPA